MEQQYKNCKWGLLAKVVSRYTLLPHTTKRRKTNFKTKNNKKFQKIELCGSLTIKDLKKKHSPRLVGGVEMDSQGGENFWQGSGWRFGVVRQWLVNLARWPLADQAVPHLHVDKPGGTTGETGGSPYNTGFRLGEIKPQNL